MKPLNRIHPLMKTRLTGYFSSLARAAVALCALAAVTLPHAHAAPPEAMTYQGYLVDANGIPLATNNPANYPVIFRIFGTATAGSSLWSEQQIVTVDKGNFSVVLSEGTAVSGEPKPLLSVVMGTNGADRYIQLSVTIGANTLDMLPRMRLLPAPFAFLSTSANQMVNPAGAAVIGYANSRVEVAGNLFASGTISGNGSGLTGLTAAQVGAGTFSDTRLSANVALRAGGNAFTGDQTISGNVGIGGPPADAALDVEGPVRLNDNDLFFRGNSDRNHGLGWYGGPGKPFAGVILDGPVLYGFGGGGLGSKSGGDKLALAWDGAGNVGIGETAPSAKLEVNGAIKISSTNTLEFGGDMPGKERNAGKIGYGAFNPGDSLDIVGAGLTNTNRKVRIFAEGGTEFTGGIRVRGGAPGLSGVNNNGYAFTGNGGDSDSGMFSSADGQVEFYSNGTERMRLSGGRLGIGTTTPAAQLHVVGKPVVNIASNQAFWGIDINDVSRDNHHMNGPGSQPVSIMADSQILAGMGFLAVSDARIKRDRQASDGAKDLETIQKLKVTNYRLIDWVTNGREQKKGFIAQEVRGVIPEAITVSRNFVPDVYSPAASVTFRPEGKSMLVRMTKAHGLQVGDKVRMMLDETTQEFVVSKAGGNLEFEVEGVRDEPKRVFVYGREVSDFMAVDYDRIFTTGVGAIQELARKVQALESNQSRLVELEKAASRAAALDKENADLRSRLEQQDKRLAALETLMRQKLEGVQQAGLRAKNVSNQ
jgi:Chaperone of endosialidase